MRILIYTLSVIIGLTVGIYIHGSPSKSSTKNLAKFNAQCPILDSIDYQKGYSKTQFLDHILMLKGQNKYVSLIPPANAKRNDTDITDWIVVENDLKKNMDTFNRVLISDGEFPTAHPEISIQSKIGISICGRLPKYNLQAPFIVVQAEQIELLYQRLSLQPGNNKICFYDSDLPMNQQNRKCNTNIMTWKEYINATQKFHKS